MTMKDNLLNITLPNMKALVTGDHNSNHAVSAPSVITEWPAISRPFPKNNSTDWKSSVQKDSNNEYAAFPTKVSAKWPLKGLNVNTF